MNYKKVYQQIIENAKTRPFTHELYYEKHHILPKCLGGDNQQSNLVKLTAREHFLAHRLLCKIYKDASIQIRSKLASAFNKMCSKNHHQRSFGSKQFEIARKEFAKNHPLKCPETLKKFKATNASKLKPAKPPLPLCQCGCGNSVKRKQNKFIQKHSYPHTIKTKSKRDEKYQKVSKTLKTFLDTLTPEEKNERYKKSFHNKTVDHAKRGANISKGKKGKKTNQVQITSERLGRMTEEQFQAYLQTINPRFRKRMTGYRNKFLYDRTRN